MGRRPHVDWRSLRPPLKCQRDDAGVAVSGRPFGRGWSNAPSVSRSPTLTVLYPRGGAPFKDQFAPTVMIGVCGVVPVSAREKNIIMKLKARLERTSVSSIQYQVSL